MNAASKFADQDIDNRLGQQTIKATSSANQTKQIRHPQKNKTVPKNKKREWTDLCMLSEYCSNLPSPSLAWPEAAIQSLPGFPSPLSHRSGGPRFK